MTGYGVDLTDLAGSLEDESGGLVLEGYGDDNKNKLEYREYAVPQYVGGGDGWDDAMEEEWNTK